MQKVFTEILVIIFIISGGVYPEQKLCTFFENIFIDFDNF